MSYPETIENNKVTFLADTEISVQTVARDPLETTTTTICPDESCKGREDLTALIRRAKTSLLFNAGSFPQMQALFRQNNPGGIPMERSHELRGGHLETRKLKLPSFSCSSESEGKCQEISFTIYPVEIGTDNPLDVSVSRQSALTLANPNLETIFDSFDAFIKAEGN